MGLLNRMLVSVEDTATKPTGIARERSKAFYSFYIAIVLNMIVDALVCIYYQSSSIFVIDAVSLLLVLLYAKKIKNAPIGAMLFIRLLMIGYAVIQCNGYTDIYGSLYYSGGSDDRHFEQMALFMIDKGMYWPWEYIAVYPLHNYSGFVSLLALVMRITSIFGSYHSFAFIVLNINIWLLTSLLVLNYLNRHFGQKASHAACAMLLLSFPNAVYITTHVFRDTLCAFLLFAGFSLIDKTNRAKGKPLLIIAVVLLASSVRLESGLMIACMMFASVLNDNTSRMKRALLLVFVAISIFLLAYVSGILDYSIAKFNVYVAYTTSTENSIINALYGMPLLPFGWLARSLYGFISPLPTGILEVASIFDNYYSFREFLVSIGMIGQILCLPFLFKRLVKLDYLAVSFLIVYLSNRLVTAGFRHIILAYPFMFIMICEQIQNTAKVKRSRTFLLSSLTLCALGICYISFF